MSKDYKINSQCMDGNFYTDLYQDEGCNGIGEIIDNFIDDEQVEWFICFVYNEETGRWEIDEYYHN